MLQTFHPVIERWFRRSFGQPTDVQTQAWKAIRSGAHTLIAAPTGSGKTLAALLPGLDAIVKDKLRGRDSARPAGVRVLYITPLKALNNDIHHHVAGFASMLEDIAAEADGASAGASGAAFAGASSGDWPGITTAVRTGDTPQSTRASMLKRPPDLLVTTPESLYLLLLSEKSRAILRTVTHVIVDEIHDLAPDKRGAHLSLSLERLSELCAEDRGIGGTGDSGPQRIGVSATQKPLETAALFLAGWNDAGEPRKTVIVESAMDKTFDVKVTMPDPTVPGKDRDAVWQSLTERIMQLLGNARTGLIFVNNRRMSERLVLRLNDRYGDGFARAHHGSVSRERRLEAERLLKAGELRCLVATSSLELGIDVGHIGVVLQIDSPGSAASGIQRIGRAGHGVGDVSVGRIIVRGRSQLPETAVLSRQIRTRDIETIRLPDAPQDVLCQQLTAYAASVPGQAVDLGHLEALLRRSAVYHEVPREKLERLLGMLSGYYPFVRPLLDWDRAAGVMRARSNTRMAALMGTGTIPSSANYPVYHADTRIQLGDLEEEFVHESRVGDVFQLGAHSWMIKEIKHDRVVVGEARNRFSEIPFWRGDNGGRSFALGEEIGRFVELLQMRIEAEAPDEFTFEWLRDDYGLDAVAAEEIVDLVRRQNTVSRMPTRRTIVAEVFRDITNQAHLVIHNYWGRRVNQAWLIALQHEWSAFLPYVPYGNAKDNGIEIIFQEWESSWIHRLWNVTADKARAALIEATPGAAMFAMSFRRMAETALLLQRGFARVPSWQKRIRGEELLRESLPFAGEFPLFQAALDECLNEHLDAANLESVLVRLHAGDISVVVTESDVPSPLAAQFTMDYVGQMIYEGDAPSEDLQRQLLSVSRELAGGVFGAVPRGGIEPAVVEAERKRLEQAGVDGGKADDLIALLKRRGDLTMRQIAAWGGDAAAGWVAEMAAAGRISPVVIAGEERWIVSDETDTYARFPDDGTAAAFVLLRWIDRQIAFTRQELQERYALSEDFAEEQMRRWRSEQRIVPAPFAEPGETTLWSSAKVSSRIVRLSLSAIREAGAPVRADRWTRRLLARHGMAAEAGSGSATPSPELRRVLELLQGLFLPVSHWESIVFPARIPGYRKEDLDYLCSSGEVVWVGQRSAGEKEGRIAFFFAENTALLGGLPAASGETAQPELLALLQERGASFLTRLSSDSGLPPSELLPKLVDLVWEGRVANDSFAPIRNYLLAKGKLNPKLGSGLGRWYAIDRSPNHVPAEECALAWAKQLLHCHGMLTKDIVAQYAPYSWEELLPVLKRLEEWGMLTRGLFIEGAAALQFMEHDAVDALRKDAGDSQGLQLADDELIIVNAVDPANPYGIALPWPEHPQAKFARKSGNQLILRGSRPVYWFESNGKHIVRLSDDNEPVDGLVPVFRRLLRRQGLKRIVIDTWNGRKAVDSADMAALLDRGAERDRGSIVLWPSTLN
ncbi:DEAD/DEAH box helicase [Paenibacillus thermotolerans]|uniref:DEAD/DEAH box helicase n=1 Tax=Paenibacillus thermotolerans TaxID=3027807 RepID=UPI002367D69D|nr:MULTISPECIES: DEAD/DEAH box helicase [unclassified Paenibacillus]